MKRFYWLLHPRWWSRDVNSLETIDFIGRGLFIALGKPLICKGLDPTRQGTPSSLVTVAGGSGLIGLYTLRGPPGLANGNHEQCQNAPVGPLKNVFTN